MAHVPIPIIEQIVALATLHAKNNYSRKITKKYNPTREMKVERVAQMLEYVAANDGVTINDISEELATSTRTVLDYLSACRDRLQVETFKHKKCIYRMKKEK